MIDKTKENELQIVSRKRVVDYGEVYTNKREVNAMLDLVAQEAKRIDSRFLEPACGTGNFLLEILERKLNTVKSCYSKSQIDYELYAILAISSMYGIDILEDNVRRCRNRLLEEFTSHYTKIFEGDVKEDCIRSAKFILEHNIVHGDTLALMTVSVPSQPIVFSEWSVVDGSMFKRRDFSFESLVNAHKSILEPSPLKDFPPVHFLKLADVCHEI